MTIIWALFEGPRGPDPDPYGKQGAEQAEGWNLLLGRTWLLQRGRVWTSAWNHSQVAIHWWWTLQWIWQRYSPRVVSEDNSDSEFGNFISFRPVTLVPFEPKLIRWADVRLSTINETALWLHVSGTQNWALNRLIGWINTMSKSWLTLHQGG